MIKWWWRDYDGIYDDDDDDYDYGDAADDDNDDNHYIYNKMADRIWRYVRWLISAEWQELKGSVIYNSRYDFPASENEIACALARPWLVAEKKINKSYLLQLILMH